MKTRLTLLRLSNRNLFLDLRKRMTALVPLDWVRLFPAVEIVPRQTKSSQTFHHPCRVEVQEQGPAVPRCKTAMRPHFPHELEGETRMTPWIPMIFEQFRAVTAAAFS